MTTMEKTREKTNTRRDRVAEIRTFIIQFSKQSVGQDDLTSLGRLSDKTMELLIEAITKLRSR